MNVSFIRVEKQFRTLADGTGSILSVSNISIKIEINAAQSVYTLPCESTVYALGNIYLSREFCDD